MQVIGKMVSPLLDDSVKDVIFCTTYKENLEKFLQFEEFV